VSDDATPRLGLPYLAASQAQKHVTLNETLSRLDGLVQTAVESRTLTDQPAGPGEGAIYILPADAVGAAWAGQPAGAAMRFEASGWSPMPVAEGHLAWVKDEGLAIVRSGDGWTALVGDGEPSFQNLPLLGVGTTADAANPLAVKAGGVLLAARGAGEGGDGDLRVTLNKEAADDTASLVFQSGWSGRAEFGLAGTEDFSVKVSPDGSVWHPAVTIARATGKATFALSPARPSEVTVFTASGDYAIPAWARRLALICIGGGGGGGSGSSGTNAANRSGGAGGGGGGRSRDEIDVSDLTGSPLSITVGDGGAGDCDAGERWDDRGDRPGHGRELHVGGPDRAKWDDLLLARGDRDDRDADGIRTRDRGWGIPKLSADDRALIRPEPRAKGSEVATSRGPSLFAALPVAIRLEPFPVSNRMLWNPLD